MGAMVTWSATVAAAIFALVVGKAQGFSIVLGAFAVKGVFLLSICPLGFAAYAALRFDSSSLVTPLHAFAQIASFNIAIWLLQFPMASLNFPAIDDALIHFEAIFGADWQKHLEWISSNSSAYQLVELVYRSLLFQIPLTCAVLGYFDPRRLKILALANTLALTATIILATIFPAGGAFAAFYSPPYPADMATQFVDVRAGVLRLLDPTMLTGIIALPSYHTILAVLIGLAFIGLPRVFRLVAPYQAAIIFSARAIGGHYYADILAGLIVAAVSNWAAMRMTDCLEARAKSYQHEIVRVLQRLAGRLLARPAG